MFSKKKSKPTELSQNMAILIEIPQSFFYNGKQKIEKKPIKRSAWIVVQCTGTLCTSWSLSDSPLTGFVELL